MEGEELRRALRLCLVTDRRRCALPLAEAVGRAVRGGVTAVQLREKDLPEGEVRELARMIRGAVAGSGALFIVNHHLGVALELADGVHLGKGGPSISEARERGAKLVGVSTHSREEAMRAEEAGASYVFFGPIFETASKPGGKPQGLRALAEVRGAIEVPLVGIGGINAGNARGVLDAGADGVAVVSSILAASDLEAAGRKLRRALEGEGE